MIFLVRHAKAVDREEWSGDDLNRPLTQKGHKQAQKLAIFFKNTLKNVDNIVSSYALRAKESAKDVASVFDKEILLDERINPEANIEYFKDFIEENYNKTLIVFGHEPLMSNLVTKLCSSGKLNIKIPKAAVIALEKKDGEWFLMEFLRKVG